MVNPENRSQWWWQVKDKRLNLGNRTWIMGILNTTPDSFSDGGLYNQRDRAIDRGLQLLSEGADIIDIGGESTRPGSEPISAAEEIDRVVPVISEIHHQSPEALISVDTSKAIVAKLALEAGAVIVNDVTGGRGDEDMGSIVASYGAGFVVMHMQGSPRTMQSSPHYENVVEEVRSYFIEQLQPLSSLGIADEQLVFDPGIGFGKSLEHNVTLLQELRQLTINDRPLLLGVSRKRWLGELTGRTVENRLAASLGGLAACIQGGAKIMRVHDVIESCDVARIIDSIG